MNVCPSRYSRRDFLRAGVAGLGGAYLASLARRLGAQDAPQPGADEEGPAEQPKTDVYEITEPRLLDEFGHVQVNDYLPGVVERLLKEMTHTRRLRNAWRKFFSPQDVIGIKFNPVAANELGTSVPLARLIVESLLSSGFDRERIMLIEGPRYTADLQTRPMPFGYDQAAIKVGAERETHLLRALGEVTALLNLPFLKDHRQVGLTCATANLALGLVSNPGVFFDPKTDPGGDPGLAELWALEPIRCKHRLTLVNAIRGIYDGGPRAAEGKLWNQCSLMAGTDPVAVDRVAVDMLNAARYSRDLKGLADVGRPPKYVEAAARMGLGEADISKIEVHRVSI